MIGIILQARMGSSRLPGKILKPIGGKVLLEHIIFRLTFLLHKVVFVIATSGSEKDDIVENFCLTKGINCFRGSETDVLQRYYLCAKKYGFSHIVRLTGDNPFVDIEELDNLIDLHLNSKREYANSFDVLPIGVGSEIFTFDALEKSYFNGREPHHREHVNEYMLENPEIFKTSKLVVSADKNKPEIRLTVDTESDYLKACYIIENSKSDFITTSEAIRLCLEYV